MDKVKITDNHQIPRRWRKGYDYFASEIGELTCSGAGYCSKKEYVKIFPLLKGEKPMYDSELEYFPISNRLSPKLESYFFIVARNLVQGIQCPKGGQE